MDYTACPRSLYQFYQLISILKLVRLLGHTIVFKLIGRYPIGQFILRKKQIITVSYRHYIYDYHDIALYLLVSCPKWGGKKVSRCCTYCLKSPIAAAICRSLSEDIYPGIHYNFQ